MTFFFIADTHFNHQNIVSFCKRPFANMKEMNEALIANWNRVVKPKDQVWHLGDVAFGFRIGDIEDILNQLNGSKHLIPGNHDKWNGPVHNWAGWDSIHWKAIEELKIDHQSIILSHYPIESWNKRIHGSWHLHGHVHNCETLTPIKHRMCVSVEQIDYTPISFEQVKEKFQREHRNDAEVPGTQNEGHRGDDAGGTADQR